MFLLSVFLLFMKFYKTLLALQPQWWERDSNRKRLSEKDSNTGTSCEYCKIFKNTFFYRTPSVAASETTFSLCWNLALLIEFSVKFVLWIILDFPFYLKFTFADYVPSKCHDSIMKWYHFDVIFRTIVQ